MIAAIKNDMIRVISKYMKIEKDAVRLTMDAGSFSDGQIHHLPVLRADIPITVHVQQGAILICFLITTLEIITFVLWPI